jgi:2-polyprenyl-3-methyl-5-hydroxy-6-metoxy-1,4-benzoquinol methylase
MKFPKYEQFGAYHWKQYADNTKYRRHADRVVKWIEEDMILDIGAGDGKITSLLAEAGKHPYGIDNEPEAV